MLHRLILSTFSFLTLATCQNTKLENSKETNDTATSTTVVNQSENTVSTSNSEENSSSTTTSTTPIKTKPKSTEPEVQPGLPPDKEAIEIGKKEAAESTEKISGVVYLNEGENKFLKEYEMNVTFKRVTEDSRCPKDVNCVWAGVATAEVELMGLATRPVTLKFSTLNDANRGYANKHVFNGLQISLVSVAPEATSEKGFKKLQGNYKIGLRFTKGKFPNTSENTGTTTR